MTIPVRKLMSVVMAMFLVLMVAATVVQFVQAPALNRDNRNVRTLYREFGNFRGPIVVAGESIAYSSPVDDAFGYQRHYPQGPLYAHVTGHYSIVYGRTALEYAENSVLNGTADSLFLSRLQSLVTGRQPKGSSIELTIDPAAQQAAWDALGDQVGAVVALDPTTGAILALVSKPSYDPALLAAHSSSAVNEAYQALIADPGSPLTNRAIAGKTYPPGSTFKLVTAAAALESGRYSADSELAAPDALTLPQTSSTLGNFGGSSCSPTGTISLSDALRISCNTAFAQLGLDLGEDALREQAEAFGFGETLRIPDVVTASSFPAALNPPQTAMAAIGQVDVKATPLAMALISSTIANGGRQMAPYLVQTVSDPRLEVISEAEPQTRARPISEGTASQLRDMMVAVVRDGSGTAARIPDIEVAGKTGTAQNADGAAPHAWFTGFAPADEPRVAVAVVVEHGGDQGNEATGGRVAAPIARAVIEAVLRR